MIAESASAADALWNVTVEWLSIPADHISFNDLDRPCDRCYGRGAILIENQGEESCPADCIDGRHTFDIEVQGEWVVRFCGGHTGEPKTYRVSIVPGMVLPIVEKWEDRPEVGPFITRFDGATRLWTDADLYEHIALPPATKAGMWAVKLKIANS